MDTMGEEMDGDDGEADGEDVEGMDVVGARGARMRLALRGLRKMPKALRGASLQGVSQAREELDSLPFTVSLVIPAGGTTSPLPGFLEAFPQRPFRGERLLLSATYVPAAASPFDISNAVVITPAWFVGAVQIGASQGQMAFSTFAPTAFGVRLSIPPAGQGSRIFIPFQVNINITAGDTVLVTASLIGRAVR